MSDNIEYLFFCLTYFNKYNIFSVPNSYNPYCLITKSVPTNCGHLVVVQSLHHVRLCNPMGCSTLGFPILHCLSEFAKTHVH